MAFRRLSSATSTSTTDLDENDDEAEKEERRSTASSLSKTSSSSIINLSPEEINNQIDQCLKLNAANKINDKNAFQLKLIDFLAYSLGKQNSKFSNLQIASACLDASGKIYGYRVDKVHSDLLKIVAGSRGEKRAHDNEEENACGQNTNGDVIIQSRKRRRKNYNLLSSPETLRGNLETYNPLSMLNNQIDMQTSDCLHQARLPKHANQGISLNLYNDVLLDRIPTNSYNSSNFLISTIEDFSCGQLCPSYAAFKFLSWSIDNEQMDTSRLPESDGEYHFDMDDPITDNEMSNHIMDYRHNQDESFDKTVRSHKKQQPLSDFEDIISNNPNPDATYEYSYLRENCNMHLVKPSHWQVPIKKDVRYSRATRSRKKVKRKKDTSLKLTQETKEEADTRFVLANKPLKLLRETYMNWSNDHITLPNSMQYDNNRFYSYFTNDKIARNLESHGKIENKEEVIRERQDNTFDLSNLGNDHHNNEDLDLNLDEQENQIPDLPYMFPDSEPPSLQTSFHEAFLGQNLVSLPKLTENIFIPYSQRAKKIDMCQLKKSIHKILENLDTKEFSELYRELPIQLSKVNIQSLSPGLAFMSLLHVSHEKTLILRNHSCYADLTVKK